MKKRNHYNWEPNQLAEHYTVSELVVWARELQVKERRFYARTGARDQKTLQQLGAVLSAKLLRANPFTPNKDKPK